MRGIHLLSNSAGVFTRKLRQKSAEVILEYTHTTWIMWTAVFVNTLPAAPTHVRVCVHTRLVF